MVFQKRLIHLLVWVTCDSFLRKRMLLHSHTHQPIKCKHAFFKYPWVKLWNDTCLQKSPRGGGRVSLSGPRTNVSLVSYLSALRCWVGVTLFQSTKENISNLLALMCSPFDILLLQFNLHFHFQAAFFFFPSPLSSFWVIVWPCVHFLIHAI